MNGIQMIKDKKIEFGSISLYIFKDDSILVIPIGLSERFGSYDLEIFLRLEVPYTDEQLENLFDEAFGKCHSIEANDTSNISPIEKFTGLRGYAKAVKGKRLVDLYWNDEDGYIITPWKKGKPRGFNPVEGHIINLGLNPNKGELAAAFREALKWCEPY